MSSDSDLQVYIAKASRGQCNGYAEFARHEAATNQQLDDKRIERSHKGKGDRHHVFLPMSNPALSAHPGTMASILPPCRPLSLTFI